MADGVRADGGRDEGVRADAAAALADRLSFQLYAASRALTSAYRRELQHFGLTYPQYLALRALGAGDGQPVSDLCAALELDSGTVSPLLSRLAAEGYIVRERVGADGRQVRVFCTDSGRELQARLEGVPAEVARSLALTEADFGQLCAMLGSLRDTARRALSDAPDPAARG
ncbi:MarR family winged helix-turn-helix transcriptional regulator [Leucobacter albus]|uniref:MarR family winged helix-turn-helix transcriptional regulator n=1 Tax=Leucobacter albus TaxID=272210 RepID=A0ABW3TKV2_9MICO